MHGKIGPAYSRYITMITHHRFVVAATDCPARLYTSLFSSRKQLRITLRRSFMCNLLHLQFR